MIARVESGAEQGAAALFAAAVGYAAYGLGTVMGLEPQLALGAAAAGALAYLPCIRGLKLAATSGPHFRFPEFKLRDFEFAEAPDELLLTDALNFDDELLLTERADASNELILTDADRVDSEALFDLDDILAELGPQSRVVRMFDRRAMPTPGTVRARIEDHLKDGAQSSAPSDASQALSAALAELRRSLR